METFYRVGNTNDEQGLWYNRKGEFTGLIHNEYDFCVNSALPMPFDPTIVGYLSTAKTIEDLYHWFSIDDLVKLNDHGIYMFEYEASDFRVYANHWVINEKTSKVVKHFVHREQHIVESPKAELIFI